jgi:hypothetical protein
VAAGAGVAAGRWRDFPMIKVARCVRDGEAHAGLLSRMTIRSSATRERVGANWSLGVTVRRRRHRSQPAVVSSTLTQRPSEGLVKETDDDP